MRINKHLNVLAIFLSITVVLDSINGFITMYIPGALEQLVPIIRILALVYYVYVIFIIGSKRLVRIFFVILIVVTSICTRVMFFSSGNISFLNDLIYFSKILYFYILTELIIALIEEKLIDLTWLKKIFTINAYLIPLLIIIPTILGISRQTYSGSDFGSSGFFIANNATNIVLIVLSMFLLYQVTTSRKKIVNFIFFSLILAALVLQGSKTSLAIIVIETTYFMFSLILIPFIYRRFSLLQLVVNYFAVCFFVVIVIFVIVKYNYISALLTSEFSGIIQREQFLIRSSNGLLDAILSGRMTMLRNLAFFYTTQVSPLLKIIGTGVAILPEGMTAEMDLVDLFVRAGILGILLTYGTVLFNLFNKKFVSKNKFAYFLLCISILYSIFAGHVFGEIIASTFVSLTIGMLLVGEKERVE